MSITYDLNEINDMFQDYYVLTGYRIAVFDKNFHEVYAYPSRFSDYCRIIRTDKKLDKCCAIDDYTHFKKCEQTLSEIIYICHAGLVEMIVPIVVDGSPEGYIMSGQICSEDGNLCSSEAIYSRFKDFTLNIDELVIELIKADKTTSVKIKSAKNLLQMYSRHIAEKQNTTHIDSLAYKIDNYIAENIKKDISVEDMCIQFDLRKTNFHKITKSLFGVSIMQYVRQFRIEKSKRLLIETDNKISEIAESVGIDDYNYFTKVFKAEVNCTPREYRKNNKAFSKLIDYNVTPLGIK